MNEAKGNPFHKEFTVSERKTEPTYINYKTTCYNTY